MWLASGEADLRQSLRRLRDARRAARGGGIRRVVDGLDVGPGCEYGTLTRDAVDDLAADVEDLKAEVGWIRRVIVATIAATALGTVLRMAGWLP